MTMNIESLAQLMLLFALCAGAWALLWRTMVRPTIHAKLRQRITRRRLELLADIETADRPHLLTLARYENLHSNCEIIDMAMIQLVGLRLQKRPDILAKIDAEREEIKAAGTRFKEDLHRMNEIVCFAIMANSPYISAALVPLAIGAGLFDSCKKKLEKLAIAEEALTADCLPLSRA